AAPDAPGRGDDGEAPEDAAAPLPTGGADGGPGGAAGWAGAPMVIAVGNDGRHLQSLDGIKWTGDVREATGNRDTGPRTLRAAAYARGTVVAVGGGCDAGCVGRIVIFDGQDWREVS